MQVVCTVIARQQPPRHVQLQLKIKYCLVGVDYGFSKEKKSTHVCAPPPPPPQQTDGPGLWERQLQTL